MTGMRMVVDSTEFVSRAENWILQAVSDVLAKRSDCYLMLAGGGTPLPVYRALARRDLPWARIVCLFGDERCVPPDDTQSNYGSITQALFPLGIPPDVRIFRMRGEEEDREDAALQYGAIMPDRVDVLLLGIGEDGHTASLFPGSAALEETDRKVMPAVGAKPPPHRLTITPPVILSAHEILVMVEGSDKSAAVHRALEEGDVPASIAKSGDWLMDKAAAGMLHAGV